MRVTGAAGYAASTTALRRSQTTRSPATWPQPVTEVAFTAGAIPMPPSRTIRFRRTQQTFTAQGAAGVPAYIAAAVFLRSTATSSQGITATAAL